ncbi:GH43 family beta-xylosidase [Amnibacterium kyonggiense]|uniref:GH43 family beta-xylosidase n=3 Tax=Amnibacterium kyonggiense TaxID=595671 RepID=A0A4R7FRA1_9MICO|nr:GH43 family beta-xylosidase [Amnibacterium kyonggiense]
MRPLEMGGSTAMPPLVLPLTLRAGTELGIPMVSSNAAVRVERGVLVLEGEAAASTVLRSTIGGGRWSVRVLPADAPLVVACTRVPDPDPDVFGPLMAHALHLAVRTRSAVRWVEGARGLAFASAVPVGFDLAEPRTVCRPSLVEAPGSWFLLAEQGLPDGSRDPMAHARVLVWRSTDLLDWTPLGGLVLPTEEANDPWAVWDGATSCYHLCWTEGSGARRSVSTPSLDPAEYEPGEVTVWPRVLGRIPVPDLGDDIGLAWSCALIDVEQSRALLESPEEGDEQASLAPFISARADPCIIEYDGAFLLVATDDRGGDNIKSEGLSLRRAESIEGLRAAAEHRILGVGPAGIAGCFWAPELHVIDGRLHCFFAPSIGSADWTAVQCHVMVLADEGDPTLAADWGTPRPVLRADGGALKADPAHPGISLDMTWFADGPSCYLIWSQRSTAPVVGDAQLWIARADPQRIDRLASPPVRLLAPTLSWEMNDAHVVEGPFAIRHGPKIILMYSAAAVGARYCTGVLAAASGADLTDPTVWRRRHRPLLSSRPELGLWGPGHNTVLAHGGEASIVFHAMFAPHAVERNTVIAPLRWRGDAPHVVLPAGPRVTSPSVHDLDPGEQDSR